MSDGSVRYATMVLVFVGFHVGVDISHANEMSTFQNRHFGKTCRGLFVNMNESESSQLFVPFGKKPWDKHFGISPNGKLPHVGNQSVLGDRSVPKRNTKVRSKWNSPKQLYFSAALTVSAAAIAQWSEERADDAYDKYLKTAARGRQGSYFSEARRYDRVAGIAFAVMEAGLFWSVYLVFF